VDPCLRRAALVTDIRYLAGSLEGPRSLAGLRKVARERARLANRGHEVLIRVRNVVGGVELYGRNPYTARGGQVRGRARTGAYRNVAACALNGSSVGAHTVPMVDASPGGGAHMMLVQPISDEEFIGYLAAMLGSHPWGDPAVDVAVLGDEDAQI
jgi:hypothetical protein